MPVLVLLFAFASLQKYGEVDVVGDFSQSRDVLIMYKTPDRLIFRPDRQGHKGPG